MSLAQSLAERLGVGNHDISEVDLPGEADPGPARASRLPEALVDAAIESLVEGDAAEDSAERFLRAVRELLGVSCAALWLYTRDAHRCIAEAGCRPTDTRDDLIEQTRIERRPVYDRPQSGVAACVVPVELRGRTIGAIEVAGVAPTWSATGVRALTAAARIIAEFVGRLQADARAEATRRLLADVLEELDEGVLVASEQGDTICSNAMMTRLIGPLDPSTDLDTDPLAMLLGRLPNDGVLQEELVLGQDGRTVAFRGRRLNDVSPPVSVLVACRRQDTAEAEAERSHLIALNALSVKQGEGVAQLAEAVAEHLRQIESGPARAALEAAGQLATLSTARESASGVASLGAEIAEIRRSKALALIVEDEDSARRALQRMLNRGGYYVLSATHAEDALAVASKYPGLVDVVISDLVLPRMSGRRLLHELAETQPQARHLLVSGMADGLEHVGRNGRPLPFLGKPFTYEQLISAVERLLAPTGRGAA